MVDTVKTSLAVRSNGVDITDKIKPYFEYLTITDKKGLESDSFTLALTDKDNQLGEPESFVLLEFIVNDINKGTFEVNDMGGDIKNIGQIEISGTSLKVKGSIKVPRSRSLEPLTISELVEQIANEHGYIPVVGNSVANIKLSHINQVKESDLNLLTRIAKDNNSTFKIADERLVFMNTDEGKNANGVDLPVMVISDPRNTTGRWTSKKRDKVGGVKVGWFDDDSNKMKFESVGEAPFKEVKQQGKNSEEAKQMANSEYNKLDKMERGLELNLPLDVKNVAGCKALISNHGFINGEWLVESFVHNISLDSYDNTSVSLVKKST